MYALCRNPGTFSYALAGIRKKLIQQNQERNYAMAEGKIFSTSKAHEITLFFDPADSNEEKRDYEIRIDGMPACTTGTTHATIPQLESDREYCFTVFQNGVLLYSITARTVKERRQISVRDFGAAGDGIAMDTEALQKAIDACTESDEVLIPKGIYKTGALRLHSNMSMYLEEGAHLLGTDDPKDYLPRVFSRFEGIEMECYSSLLNIGVMDHTKGPDCENILIHGKGTIESGGAALARNVIEQERARLSEYLRTYEDLVKTCENEDTVPGRVRPKLISIANCRNVRISGLTLKNGACWNVHMIYSEDIITDHCTFVSEGVWNGDGWDPDSSNRCSIFACTFSTGDDCVAVKSGKNPEGNIIARPCTEIRIFDCRCLCGHGIAIGSEISGGIRDVRIYDCDFEKSFLGVLIKSTRKRGGYVKDIRVTDSVLPSVLITAVTFNDDGVPTKTPPKFSSFRFEHLRLTGRSFSLSREESEIRPIELHGFDEEGYEIRDVRFRGCVIEGKEPVLLSRCERIVLEDMHLKA